MTTLRLRFKQAVCIDKKDYTLGIHEVPMAHCEHEYMQRLAKLGLVEEVDAEPVLTNQERNEMLYDKLQVPPAPLADILLGGVDAGLPVSGESASVASEPLPVDESLPVVKLEEGPAIEEDASEEKMELKDVSKKADSKKQSKR